MSKSHLSNSLWSEILSLVGLKELLLAPPTYTLSSTHLFRFHYVIKPHDLMIVSSYRMKLMTCNNVVSATSEPASFSAGQSAISAEKTRIVPSLKGWDSISAYKSAELLVCSSVPQQNHTSHSNQTSLVNSLTHCPI